MLFRLTGYQQLSAGSGRRLYRYMMFFKLSRDPASYPIDEDAGPARTPYGDYTVGPARVGLEDFFTPVGDGPPQCMQLLYAGGPAGDVSFLNRIRPGARVKVTLRPLDPLPGGGRAPGKTYTARPRLRSADVLLRGTTARRELKRIGCDKAVPPSNDR